MVLIRASKWSFWQTVVDKLDSIISALGGGSGVVLVDETRGTTGTTTITKTGTIVNLSNDGANDLTFQPSSYAAPITVKAGSVLEDIPFDEFASVEIISTDDWQILIYG